MSKLNQVNFFKQTKLKASVSYLLRDMKHEIIPNKIFQVKLSHNFTEYNFFLIFMFYFLI